MRSLLSKNINKLIYLSILLFWIEPIMAAEPLKSVPTIGEIAEKLIVGTDVVTRIVLGGCVAVGAMLIVTSFIYYKAHRENPKFAPLDRPLFYLLFGLILLFIPFLGKIFGPTGSALELNKKTVRESGRYYPNDIDAPLEFGNEYDH